LLIEKPSRSAVATVLCLIAAVSAIQTSGIIPHPAFADNDVTTTNGTAGSVSTTETLFQTATTSATNSSSSETETTTTIFNNTLQTEVHVEPSSRSITAGAYASYNINIHQHDIANVFLAAKGVPPQSVAIFSQDKGIANPEFRSTLTIVTSATTPPTTYGITVVALVKGQEFDTQVSLEVVSSTTTTSQTSIAVTVSAGTALSLTMDTDRHHYEPNATIHLEGHVADDSGNLVANADVTVQVDAQTGAEVVYIGNLKTGAAGIFQASFPLPKDASAGTYTAFAAVSKQGYVGATTRTTFVVQSSSTPSVVIQAVYAGDSAGNPTAVFSAGQTVYVWVVVENIGPTFQGVIWVQVRDPNGIPVQVSIRISSMKSGDTIKDGVGFILLGKPSPGLYPVNALVSDNLISQGGVFLASSDAQFAVAAS